MIERVSVVFFVTRIPVIRPFVSLSCYFLSIYFYIFFYIIYFLELLSETQILILFKTPK